MMDIDVLSETSNQSEHPRELCLSCKGTAASVAVIAYATNLTHYLIEPAVMNLR